MNDEGRRLDKVSSPEFRVPSFAPVSSSPQRPESTASSELETRNSELETPSSYTNGTMQMHGATPERGVLKDEVGARNLAKPNAEREGSPQSRPSLAQH